MKEDVAGWIDECSASGCGGEDRPQDLLLLRPEEGAVVWQASLALYRSCRRLMEMTLEASQRRLIAHLLRLIKWLIK